MKAHIQKGELPEMKEPFVPMKHLRDWVKNNSQIADDDPLTFSFILTLCFPQAWNNIQQYAKECWEAGFKAAKGELDDAGEDDT